MSFSGSGRACAAGRPQSRWHGRHTPSTVVHISSPGMMVRPQQQHRSGSWCPRFMTISFQKRAPPGMRLRRLSPIEIPPRKFALPVVLAVSIRVVVAVFASAAQDAARSLCHPLQILVNAEPAAALLRMPPISPLASFAAEARPLVIALSHVDEFPALRAPKLPKRQSRYGVVLRMVHRVMLPPQMLTPAGAETAPLRLRHKQRPALVARPLPGPHVLTPFSPPCYNQQRGDSNESR